MTIFQSILAGLFIGGVLILLFYPYYSIPDIHTSIDKQTEAIKELTKAVRESKEVK